jgi:hypothetical protein
MMRQIIAGAGFLLVLGVSLAGCDNGDTTPGAAPGSSQEERGLGIVQGTLGAQSARATPEPGAAMVQGQVLAIEGGAYVVREFGGQERRLPLDENTAIDRPAHVGDHIEAHLDPANRAVLIRNIDEDVAGEPPSP